MAYSAGQFFTVIFQCTPVNYLWGKTIPGGHCFDSGILVIVGGALNAVTDVLMLILPIPVLWKLQMSTRKKWTVSAIFLMGGL